MAEEKKSFGRKVLEVLQTIGAGAGIIALQHTIEEALTGAGKKAGEKASEKMHEWLGLNTTEAKKSIDDEAYFSAGIHGGLSEDEIDEINAFEARLRSESREKAEAFVLFIARLIQKFERDEKRTIPQPKGSKGPPSEQIYKDITEGVAQATNFLKDLLRQKGTTDDETYRKRLAFIEGKNVFSLISESKPVPAVEVAKKVFDWSKEKASEVADAEKRNADDFNSKAISWADRMIARRDAMRRR